MGNFTELFKIMSELTLDRQYQGTLHTVLAFGKKKGNRTGVDTIALPSSCINHNMADGFPILTTKRVPFKLVASELEFFIKGLRSKKWLQERNNHIWDEWCNPEKVPYGTDEVTKSKMAAEDDLGLIYGTQWRDFHDPVFRREQKEIDYAGEQYEGVDQLKQVISKLKSNPQDRRMLCSAWNPLALNQMALPPCHVLWQVTVIDNKLHLSWYQRSCDAFLGVPFNISSYGLLLHLLTKEVNVYRLQKELSLFEEGELTGFFTDYHIYENHESAVREQLTRNPDTYKLPIIKTENFTSIFDWKYTDSQLVGYQSFPAIKAEIAI